MTDAIDLTPIPERGARRTGRCMGGKRRPVAWATQSLAPAGVKLSIDWLNAQTIVITARSMVI
jgi:hypothetical protein